MREPSPAQWARVDRFPLVGVAVDVRSLFNVGALFRASDAARVAHLYLTGGTGHPARERERIEKTGLGSPDSVPWTWSPHPDAVLTGLRRRGYKLVALELTPQSVPIDTVDHGWFPLALIVGHETEGVRPDVLAQCDAVVALDSYGRKHSMNVAMAYGVGIVHCARLWANRPPAEAPV